MTSRERVKRMYEHRDADRVPVRDGPWGPTVDRWVSEGMPTRDYARHLGMDEIAYFHIDSSPRFPWKNIFDDGRIVITKNNEGAIVKNMKHSASVPEDLDFFLESRDTWEIVKGRMKPDDTRINWAWLDGMYKGAKEAGAWIELDFWYGFDVTHSRMMGTEQTLLAMVEDPEMVVDIFNTRLDLNIAMCDRILAKGYEFDAVIWADDMGYKNATFFSVPMYRELLKPVQKRMVEYVHSKGMKAMLHSCGNVNALLPDLMDVGIDGLNPMEVKAGMNPYEIKQKYGDRLVLKGGIDALLLNDGAEAFMAEMERLVPHMKKDGGYIFATDHSIPSCISYEGIKRIIARAKELGSYS